MITDFVEDVDVVRLGGVTAADVSEMDVGNDVVLTVNGGGTITVINGVLDDFSVSFDVDFV